MRRSSRHPKVGSPERDSAAYGGVFERARPLPLRKPRCEPSYTTILASRQIIKYRDIMMARQHKESLLLPQLLKKIAPTIGARVYIEPEWGVAGQITFRDGKKRYFRYNTLDLNPVGSSVIVKPNEGSHGTGVFLVRTKREFMRAMQFIFKHDRVALVQRVVRGRDYRIVVLNSKVISAYERIPLSVVGDGSSSIQELLKKKQKRFRGGGRDTRIRLDDIRIAHKIGLQKLALRSVPERGKRIYLLDNANLSSGGDAVDVTKPIHPEFKKMAIKLTRDMGLRLSGVDIMVAGDIRNAPKKYWVLEINAAPGLDHYVKTGLAQQKIVENLYLKVLRSLARGQ